MALTTDQLTDLQSDLGITSDQAVFTDAELNRLYERAESDYNTAVYLGWRQLMADAAKFANYRAGQTSLNRSEVFEHIKAMVAFWADESRVASSQFKIVGLTEVPPRRKAHPDYPVSRDKRPTQWRGGYAGPDTEWR